MNFISKTVVLVFSLSILSFELQGQNDQINSVLGNESWLQKHNASPNQNDSEKERIVTHLCYVLDILKNNETPSPQLAQERALNIHRLEEYILRGEFPLHEKSFKDRVPRFIDHQGNICAVGYLVEQSAGREEAERINEKYEYAQIFDIDDKGLRNWQNSSGLTLKELAMIQPTYDYRRTPIVSPYHDQTTGRYGLIDNHTQKHVTKAIYTQIIPVQDDAFFLALKYGVWGVLNHAGKEVVDFQYDRIRPVQVGNRSNFMAHDGETLEIYDENAYQLASLENGHFGQYTSEFFVVRNNQGTGVIDMNGSQVIPFKYSEIRIEYLLHYYADYNRVQDYKNKHLFVVSNTEGKQGVMDGNGDLIVSFDHSKITRQEYVLFAKKEDANVLYGLNGMQMSVKGVEAIKPISNRYGAEDLLGRINGKWGLISKEGEWAIQPEYKQIKKVIEFYECQTDSTVSYFNLKFQPFVPEHQNFIQRYSGTIHFGTTESNAVKKIDGSYLIEPTADSIKFLVYRNSRPVYALQKSGKWQLIFYGGKEIRLEDVSFINRETNNAVRFKRGSSHYFGVFYRDDFFPLREISFDKRRHIHQGIYAIKKDNSFGMVRLTSKHPPFIEWMYPMELDSIDPMVFDYNNVVLVKKAGMWGVLELWGKEIVPFEFSDFRAECESRVVHKGVYLKKGTQWFYFDCKKRTVLEVLDAEIQHQLNHSGYNHCLDTNGKKLKTWKE
ncbi:MAG: WG repeat-containing protein [Schleiferiaceae bacterium]|nr:WG repeat-containing protein [Schleiferiaceae bacterium]